MIPAPVRRLLARLLPAADRDEVAGDLEEERARLASERGRLAADLRFLRRVLTTPVWLWTERARRGAELLGGGSLRHAVRSFRRDPLFTTAALLTLSLGIGATTAVYSVVDGVLLEPLPWPESDRLVSISHSLPGLGVERAPSTFGTLLVYGPNATTLSGTALYAGGQANLTGLGAPERIELRRVTPSLFDVLRTSPPIGRGFTPAEGRTGGPRVVVVDHAFWADRLGGDPAVLERSITLDGESHRIVGVLPPDAALPGGGDADILVPLVVDPDAASFGGFNYGAVGRLAPGATVEAAERELEALEPRMAERFDDLTPSALAEMQMRVRVESLLDETVGDVRASLWILLGTVGFVLLIACANVANLMLVRAESRRREVAVRSALGAGRGRLAGDHLAESLTLSAGGAVLGTLFAAGGLELVRRLGGGAIPRLDGAGIDGTVLLATAGVTVVAALVFGLVPVVRHRELDVAAALRAGGGRGATDGRTRIRSRELLVAGQVALALVLLVGSGLMLRSFDRIRHVDPGFDARGVLTFRISLPRSRYPDGAAIAAFHRRFAERLESLARVEAAGAVSTLPLSGDVSLNTFTVRSDPPREGELGRLVEVRTVTPGYFDALGIPLLRGRHVTWGDVTDRSGAAVVSRRVADEQMTARDPLGDQVATTSSVDGDVPWSTVVGVVEEVHNSALTKEPIGTMYLPVLPREGLDFSWQTRSMSYAVRSATPPATLLPTVRELLAELDPGLPIADASTLGQRLRRSSRGTVFTMTLLGIAALVGLMLGAVGLYGVISHVTASRTREIGVRLALGARRAAVRRRVVLRSVAVTSLGLAVGLPVAWLASRALGGLLYGVEPTDPLTYSVVSAVLLLTSVLAAWLPARRASSIDPVAALRTE